jgi:hypothetical protein
MFAWSLLSFPAIPVLISADKLGKMLTVIEVCLKLFHSKLKQDRDETIVLKNSTKKSCFSNMIELPLTLQTEKRPSY